MTDRTWFSHCDFTTLEIVKYHSISDHRVAARVVLEDAAMIQKFVQRIQGIDAQGEMYISFGPAAESIDLLFHTDGKHDLVQIYNQRFKRPSTSFGMRGDALESALYAEIDALLFPACDKELPMVRNLALQCDDFSVTWLGSNYKDYAPITIQISTQNFLIRDQSGAEQRLEISCGQLPPAPCQFTVNGRQLTLYTWKKPDGNYLRPDNFLISTTCANNGANSNEIMDDFI